MAFSLWSAVAYLLGALFLLGVTGLTLVVWDGCFGLLVPGFHNWPDESGFAAFRAYYFPPHYRPQAG